MEIEMCLHGKSGRRQVFNGTLDDLKSELAKQGGLRGIEAINCFNAGRKIARLTK